MSPTTRTVYDGVGHQVRMTLTSEGLVLGDGNTGSEAPALTRQEVEILHAFLAVCLRAPRERGRVETLTDDRSLTLLETSNPHVRLAWNDGHMDIHPVSWEPMLCEIALLLPRMKSNHG